jgi:hypothetical protein
MRSHRKMGIATRLMRASHRDMKECYGAKYVSLHVRAGNKAGRHMYEDTLGYTLHEVEKRYYADGENAHCMRLYFSNADKPGANNNNNNNSAAVVAVGTGGNTATTTTATSSSQGTSNNEILRCSFCNNVAAPGKTLAVCKACGLTRYCGKECQTQDWPSHKGSCKVVQEQKKLVSGGSQAAALASGKGGSGATTS